MATTEYGPAQLASELRAQVAMAPAMVAPIVAAATASVLAGWQEKYSTIKSKPRIAQVLGSNVWAYGGVVIGEVGVTKSRRGKGGSFAHIIEFGSVNNPPRNDGGEALIRATGAFHAAMLAVAASLFRGQPPRVQFASTTPGRFNAQAGSD